MSFLIGPLSELGDTGRLEEALRGFLCQIHITRKARTVGSPSNRVWGCTPVIPELRRLEQEDYEVEASLG